MEIQKSKERHLYQELRHGAALLFSIIKQQLPCTQ